MINVIKIAKLAMINLSVYLLKITITYKMDLVYKNVVKVCKT